MLLTCTSVVTKIHVSVDQGAFVANCRIMHFFSPSHEKNPKLTETSMSCEIVKQPLNLVHVTVTQ